MAVERNFCLSLIVAVTAFLLCRAAEMRSPIVRTDTENQGTDHHQQKSSAFPVELFGDVDDNSITVAYAMRLFKDLDEKLTQCREQRRAILSKKNHQSASMHEYYESLRKVIDKPKFEDLVHENKMALEKNFEEAFAELEHSRLNKLEKQREKCKKELDTLVERKVHEAVTFAEMFVIQDPRRYESLTLEASTFGTRLRGALAECSSHEHSSHAEEDVQANSHGEMTFDLCRRYFLVIERLIEFIDQFLSQTDELSQKYLYTDDEDFDYGDNVEEESGDFGDYYDNPESPEQKPVDVESQPTAVPKPHPPKFKGQLPISAFFEPGPVILGTLKPEDEKTKVPTSTTEKPSQESPSTEDVAPPIKNDDAPPTSQAETKPEDVGDYNYDGGEKEGTVTTTTTESTGDIIKEEVTESNKPTHEYPTWVDDAFDYILDHDNKKGGEQENEEEKEFETSPFGRAKSTSREEEEEEPYHQGSIDIDLPGIEVEIDSDGINVEENDGQQGDGQLLSIMIDNDEAAPTEPESSEEEEEEDSTTFIEYMLIYFFATLGCLLILAIIVLSIAIIALRSRSRTPKDTPLLSEDDKIAVMKQTGYVNPTYKFFDSVKEV